MAAKIKIKLLFLAVIAVSFLAGFVCSQISYGGRIIDESRSTQQSYNSMSLLLYQLKDSDDVHHEIGQIRKFYAGSLEVDELEDLEEWVLKCGSSINHLLFDGWGNPYQFVVARDSSFIVIISGGSDGKISRGHSDDLFLAGDGHVD